MVLINKKHLCSFVFSIYLFFEIMFANSIFSQISLLLFVVTTLVALSPLHWSRNLTFYALYIIFAFLNVVTGNAESSLGSLSLIITCTITFVFLYALTCLIDSYNNIEDFTVFYIYVVLLVAIIYLVSGIISGGIYDRLTGTINANKAAILSAFALIMLLKKTFDKQINIKFSVIMIIIFLITIILSGSRKGFLTVLLGGYILLCFRKPKQILKVSAVFLILLAVVFFLIMNVDFLYNSIGNRVETVFLFFQKADIEEGSFLSRQKFINLAWEGSKDKIIIGHGLGSFSLLPEAYGTYSHCNYLEVLYSLGIVGVILFYYPMFWSFIQAIRYNFLKVHNVSLILALLVPFLICDYMMVTYYMRVYLVIPLLCVIAVEQIRRKNGDNKICFKKSV